MAGLDLGSITVWGRTNSVNVQKVLWCLGELELAYERIDAGLQYGRNDEPWFLALNPNGMVPLLRVGSFTLWESNTIVRYLSSCCGVGTLYPRMPEARALAEQWMDWQLSVLVRPVGVVFWGLIRTAERDRDESAIRRATREANAAFDILDHHLARHSYVAGDSFTMGDIPVGAVAHRWLALEDVEKPEWPSLQRWFASLAQRPSFREHVMLALS